MSLSKTAHESGRPAVQIDDLETAFKVDDDRVSLQTLVAQRWFMRHLLSPSDALKGGD